MVHKLSLLIISLSTLGLSACSSTLNSADNLEFTNDGKYIGYYDSDDMYQERASYSVTASGFSPKGQVNIWAEKIANELILQNDSLRSDQPLLVTTPVMTQDFNQTNELALQLQQGLIAAMHAHELNLVDLNVSSALRATPNGEFILSRNWENLPSDLPVSHVLVSTLNLTTEGINFNGRIVDITNNRVVSAVQSFVSGKSLSGYVMAGEKVQVNNGMIYRNENQDELRYQVLGDKQ